MSGWHLTFPDVQVQTVLRSICQRWPSSTSRPSHSHRCLTHSHPSRYFTRDCRSSFCYKTISINEIQRCHIIFHGQSYIRYEIMCGYLSFDHVQHTSKLFQPLLHSPQPLISLGLRNRLDTLRRSWGPQNDTSLYLVTLDVWWIMAVFFLHWPRACLKFTIGSTLLNYLTVRIWALGVCLLRWEQDIWEKRQKRVGWR